MESNGQGSGRVLQFTARARRHGSGLGGLSKLWPVSSPIGAKLTTGDGATTLPLDVDSKVGGARLVPIHHISKVLDGCSAALGECLSGCFVRKPFEESFEVHGSITPDGVFGCQHRSVSDTDSTPVYMADDALIRRANFKRLMTSRSLEVKGMTEHMGWGRYSYWKDLYDGTKAFGEKAARKIEEKLELPRGWLDTEGAPLSANEADLAARQPVAAPPAPPADFADNRTLSDSDWATLEAVKVMLPEAELKDIVRRHQLLRAQTEERLRREQARAAGHDEPALDTNVTNLPHKNRGHKRVASPLSGSSAQPVAKRKGA